MNQDNLLKYIENCYLLEKSAYTQARVNQLYEKEIAVYTDYKKFQYAFYRIRTCIPDEYNIFSNHPNYLKSWEAGNYTSCAGIIGNRGTEKPYSPNEVKLYLNVIKGMKFGFFESESSKARKKLAAYNIAVDEINEETEIENEEIKNKCKRKVDILKSEYEDSKQRERKTRDILEQYYSRNIIFPKYRKFVAISSLYEYFLSGRCTTLPDAYNKYEDEILHRVIIDKLDIIINKLDAIEQNQYMLYEALRSMNSTLNQISNEVESSLDSLTQIKDNTYISTYNSKVISDNQKRENELIIYGITYNTVKDIINEK